MIPPSSGGFQLEDLPRRQSSGHRKNDRAKPGDLTYGDGDIVGWEPERAGHAPVARGEMGAIRVVERSFPRFGRKFRPAKLAGTGQR